MRSATRIIMTATSLALPALARAQGRIAVITDDLPGCDFITGKLESKCIPIFIGHLIQLVFGLVGMFFILNVIYAGYQFALGSYGGDRDKGKSRLIWSVIGLAVTSCAFLILDLVLTVIGV